MKLHFAAASGEFVATAIRTLDTIVVTPASGEPIALRIIADRDDHLILEYKGRRFHMRGVADGDERQLWVDGRTLRYRRQPMFGQREPVGDLSLTSTIPAVVLEVLVNSGDMVHEGQKLLLLESMKMVMPIVASKAGTVRAILCEEGEAVQPGVPLIEFEVEEGQVS